MVHKSLLKDDYMYSFLSESQETFPKYCLPLLVQSPSAIEFDRGATQVHHVIPGLVALYGPLGPTLFMRQCERAKHGCHTPPSNLFFLFFCSSV